jgi:poly(A) polymerase
MRELGQWWAHAQRLPQDVLAAALPVLSGAAAAEAAPAPAVRKPPRPRRRRRKRSDNPASE